MLNWDLLTVSAYWRERLTAMVGTLVLMLWGASYLVEPFRSFGDALTRMVVVMLLVMQFRLWDDLEDLERDRREHPQRVLANSTSLVPFGLHLAALTSVAAIALLAVRSWPQWLAAVILDAVLWSWYRAVHGRKRSPLVHALVILLKYPVIVFLVTPWDPANWVRWRPWAIVLGLYLILVIYECLDDSRARTRTSEPDATEITGPPS